MPIARGRSERAQECEQRLVHFLWTFLLNPVARSWYDERALQSRRVLGKCLNRRRSEAPNAILFTRNEERRLADLGVLQKPRELPGTIEIAIPVKAPAKARTF